MPKTPNRPPALLIRLEPDQMADLKQRAVKDERTPTNLARKFIVEQLRRPTREAA